MNTFTFIFLLAVAVSFALHYWLALRQANYVAEHRSAVPDAFKSKVSLEAHQKAADYTLAKGKLGNIDSIISTIALLLFTLGGIINAIFNYWAGAIASPLVGCCCHCHNILSDDVGRFTDQHLPNLCY